MQPDGQAIAVGNSHNFRAFAYFDFANAKALFFAGTKRPSTNACAHSISPWASNQLNNARQIRFHVPSLVQAQKRRQQVTGEPYTRGTFLPSASSLEHAEDAVERCSIIVPFLAWARLLLRDQKLYYGPWLSSGFMSTRAHSLTPADQILK
jgi:hypothetical protein